MTYPEVTPVSYRRYKNGGDVIAVLGEIEMGKVTIYQRIGQHGEAGYYYLLEVTKKIKDNPPDVQSLEAELISIGYTLERVNRHPKKKVTA
jgi:hypothetical protein